MEVRLTFPPTPSGQPNPLAALRAFAREVDGVRVVAGRGEVRVSLDWGSVSPLTPLTLTAERYGGQRCCVRRLPEHPRPARGLRTIVPLPFSSDAPPLSPSAARLAGHHSATHAERTRHSPSPVRLGAARFARRTRGHDRPYVALQRHGRRLRAHRGAFGVQHAHQGILCRPRLLKVGGMYLLALVACRPSPTRGRRGHPRPRQSARAEPSPARAVPRRRPSYPCASARAPPRLGEPGGRDPALS